MHDGITNTAKEGHTVLEHTQTFRKKTCVPLVHGDSQGPGFLSHVPLSTYIHLEKWQYVRLCMRHEVVRDSLECAVPIKSGT